MAAVSPSPDTKLGNNQDGSSATLRVLTLNFWGIPAPGPLGSSDRKQRLSALADTLLESNYDMVSLQEVWSWTDYDTLRKAVESVLPHAHYFHSGYIGSGVCVLSRHRILDALMHRYSLNGFAHHVHRGDWFGGKVVGLAVIAVRLPDVHQPPLIVNLYCTHIHAEYNRDNDLYLPHRVVQAFELAQFVRHTSQQADLCVACGDLNLEPTDLGMHLVQSVTGLGDAWKEQSSGASAECGMTCDRPDNCYTQKSMLERYPHGKRIDYILYKHAEDISTSLLDCDVRLNQISPETFSSGGKSTLPLCYSDHAAVYVRLHVQRRSGAAAPRPRMSLELQNAEQAMITRFTLAVLLAFLAWYGLIGLQLEAKALAAAKCGMQLLLATATRPPSPEVGQKGEG